MYEDIIKVFEDSVTGEVFESIEFKLALKQLQTSKTNLKFLVGKAGTGKTFLINYLFKDNVYLATSLTREKLDSILVKNQLIVIDEAQLLDESLVEYIRTLTDTKEYQFLLSIHLEDAQKLLKKEHFKTRDIDIIEIKLLTKEDMIRYINVTFLKNNITLMMKNSQFDKIYNYTKGNFRYIKKFMRVLFELLQFAQDNNLTKYFDINDCLITMTAIQLGLEND